MPNVSYDNTSSSSKGFVSSTIPKPKLPKISFNFKAILKTIAIIATAIGVSFLSAVLAGVVMALGGNVTVANLDIIFDPQITIAYILTFYFLSHFYDLPRRQMYNFFLLSLFLSFAVNYIQGAILLVILPPILKKLHLISQPEPKT